MSQTTEPITVQLSPTRGQYVQAFMWVLSGLFVSGFFIWLSLRGNGTGTVSLIIGLVVLVIALASAVLEYRNLPGVALQFADGRLRVQPHSGDPVDVSLADVGRLETVHVTPVTRRMRRRDALLPGHTARPSFAAPGQGGWHLNVVLADGEPAGPVTGYRIGLDEERTNALREACRRAGVQLRLGS